MSRPEQADRLGQAIIEEIKGLEAPQLHMGVVLAKSPDIHSPNWPNELQYYIAYNDRRAFTAGALSHLAIALGAHARSDPRSVDRVRIEDMLVLGNEPAALELTQLLSPGVINAQVDTLLGLSRPSTSRPVELDAVFLRDRELDEGQMGADRAMRLGMAAARVSKIRTMLADSRTQRGLQAGQPQGQAVTIRSQYSARDNYPHGYNTRGEVAIIGDDVDSPLVCAVLAETTHGQTASVAENVLRRVGAQVHKVLRDTAV